MNNLFEELGVEVSTNIYHRTLLQRAFVCAHTSPDPSTKVGSVIANVNLTHVLAYGANDFPKGFEYDEGYLYDREWKLANIIHAEANALNDAKQQNFHLISATQYVTIPSCMDCSNEIIDSGIPNMIVPEMGFMKKYELFGVDKTVDPIKFLLENKVNFSVHRGKIGQQGLIRGEPFYP